MFGIWLLPDTHHLVFEIVNMESNILYSHFSYAVGDEKEEKTP